MNSCDRDPSKRGKNEGGKTGTVNVAFQNDKAVASEIYHDCGVESQEVKRNNEEGENADSHISLMVGESSFQELYHATLKHKNERSLEELSNHSINCVSNFISKVPKSAVEFDNNDCPSNYNIGIADTGSSVYDISFLGRADIFRPMLTGEERKMLGIGSIPTFLFPGTAANSASDMEGRHSPVPHSPSCPRLLSPRSPSASSSNGGGGGDADQQCHKSISFVASASSEMNLSNPIRVSEYQHSVHGLISHNSTEAIKTSRKQKRVSFSVCEDPVKENDGLKCQQSEKMFADSLPRFAGRTKKATGIKEDPVDSVNFSRKNPSEEDNISRKFISKTETFNRFVNSLSVQSLKSKKLETKLQQDMRVAFFDFEARRASEDWKFRKNVEALDLEYQKKLVKLVENHNSFLKKLQERFLKRIRKTDKKLKKEALQGRINEGNCFSLSHRISNFLNQNR